MENYNLITLLKKNRGAILTSIGGALLGAIAPIPVMAIVLCVGEKSFDINSYSILWYALIDLAIWLLLRQINRTSGFWYLLLNLPVSAYFVRNICILLMWKHDGIS